MFESQNIGLSMSIKDRLAEISASKIYTIDEISCEAKDVILAYGSRPLISNESNVVSSYLSRVMNYFKSSFNLTSYNIPFIPALNRSRQLPEYDKIKDIILKSNVDIRKDALTVLRRINKALPAFLKLEDDIKKLTVAIVALGQTPTLSSSQVGYKGLDITTQPVIDVQWVQGLLAEIRPSRSTVKISRLLSKTSDIKELEGLTNEINKSLQKINLKEILLGFDRISEVINDVVGTEGALSGANVKKLTTSTTSLAVTADAISISMTVMEGLTKLVGETLEVVNAT